MTRDAAVTIEWECPRCGSLYVSDVGTCGQNLPYVCREAVVPRLAPTDDAIERACMAYDDDWYPEKDHEPAGADTWDLMAKVLRSALADGDTFHALTQVAQMILDRHYPEDVFPGPFNKDADPGTQLVVALRAVSAASQDNDRQEAE